MDEDYIPHIGDYLFQGYGQPFGLRREDRRHHVYAIGKTGTGKSTLLKNLIVQDIEAGLGVAVIDPHGDLAEDILEHIPPWRMNDVVYFDPADLGHPMGFNLLGKVPHDERHLVASEVVSIFKSIWKDFWGPRLEYILFATLLALLECREATMLGVHRMLTDSRYRAWVLKQVSDPMVKGFWTDEFARYDKKFLNEAISPIMNKVGTLLMPSAVRNVLGQVRSRIDLRFMMDNRRILIANLGRGRLGDTASQLLGSVLISKFQLAAMSRSDIPERERKDFFLYVDEFQNFATDSFASILSEARKYRLCLTLSHQYLGQVPERLREAVLGNAGSLISFRLGSEDARAMSAEFGGSYTPKHFMELSNRQICVKLLAGGESLDPFTAAAAPPQGRRYGRGGKIIKRSRERYGRPREEIEGKLRRWLGKM